MREFPTWNLETNQDKDVFTPGDICNKTSNNPLKFCNRKKFFQPSTIHVLVSFLVHEFRQGEKNIWGPSVGKVWATCQLSIIWHACRSRGNELQCLPRGDPRNLCANTRIRLLATHSLMSVNMWTECCSTYRLILSCYVDCQCRSILVQQIGSF